MKRIPDDELADLCERNGWPSVGQYLADGWSQEGATAYVVGVPPRYSDGEARWLQDYLELLHGPRVRQYHYYGG